MSDNFLSEWDICRACISIVFLLIGKNLERDMSNKGADTFGYAQLRSVKSALKHV